ncbi:MAG TPA: sulfatase [Anaerolineae bacterium]|nr:sulfatase [Anaerolineae bacterium]
MNKTPTRRDFLKLATLAPILATATYAGQATLQSAQSFNRPNVLFILFDTLSARHMSLYGYPRETTPNLKRFAKRATVFHKHYAGGNYTSPATASLLTGAYTWSQRGFNFMATVSEEFERQHIFRVFADAGYYRFAYTHNWLAAQLLNQFRSDITYWKPTRELCLTDTEFSDQLFANDHAVALAAERVTAEHGTVGTGSLFLSLLNRFVVSNERKALMEKYAARFPKGLPTNLETTLFVMEDAIDWVQLQVMQAPRPFFGYIHLLPPHEPYRPREEFTHLFINDRLTAVPKPLHPLSNTRFDEQSQNVTRRNYDQYVAYADSEFGRLYDFLQQSGLLDTTYLIFTADHGQLFERGTKGHFNSLLYESITHIPLLISAPGQNKRFNVRKPTSCLDVLPTLAQIAEQPIPVWGEGQLLPRFGGQANSERSIFTVEAKSNAKAAPITKATVSMIKDNYKVIHYRGYDKGYQNVFEVYDLDQDPQELTDLHSIKPETSSELEHEMIAKLDEVNRPYQRG